jgi:hypothetical protein
MNRDPHKAGPMRRFAPSLALAAVWSLAALATACVATSGSSGSFDRTLTVNGPARLELTNGSGNTQITTGPAGQVRIHGDFRVMRLLPWEDGQARAAKLTKNPPIEQDQNLIRVGAESSRLRQLQVNYTIVVPIETEVRATTGSGDIRVNGIRGPATLTAGSGKITAEQIGEDTQATAGSGDIRLTGVKGEAHDTAGSGDITLAQVTGEVRASAGSGNISVQDTAGPATIKAGSGDIRVVNALADLRVHTGSGDITVEGNPTGSSYWELRAGSGEISLHVPQNASFRFHAYTHFGEIQTAMPIKVEEQSKHELRGQFGQGSGRVDVETGSGNIAVR